MRWKFTFIICAKIRPRSGADGPIKSAISWRKHEKSRPEGASAFCSSSGISCIVWLVSGAVSLRESREKVDGFLISIKCCWHGSLLQRIGQRAVPGAQKAPTVLLIKSAVPMKTKPSVFAVFDSTAGRLGFMTAKTAAILLPAAVGTVCRVNASTVKNGGSYGLLRQTENIRLRSDGVGISRRNGVGRCRRISLSVAGAVCCGAAGRFHLVYRSRVRAAAPFGRRFWNGVRRRSVTVGRRFASLGRLSR